MNRFILLVALFFALLKVSYTLSTLNKQAHLVKAPPEVEKYFSSLAQIKEDDVDGEDDDD